VVVTVDQSHRDVLVAVLRIPIEGLVVVQSRPKGVSYFFWDRETRDIGTYTTTSDILSQTPPLLTFLRQRTERHVYTVGICQYLYFDSWRRQHNFYNY
jgi:hypothetical protein